MNLKQQFKTGCFNQKHSILPVEKVQVGTLYSFTLSPTQEFQNFDEPLRLLKTYEQVKKNLQLEFNHCIYELYPEISTKSQNIHWHGYIWFKKQTQIGLFYLYLHRITPHYTYELDTIKDYNWYLYITKQRYIMEPLCNMFNIPYKLTPREKISTKTTIKQKTI